MAYTANHAKSSAAALILVLGFLVSIPVALAGTAEIIATDSFPVSAQFEVVHEKISETASFSSDPGFPATVRAVFRDPSMLTSDTNRVDLVSMRLTGISNLVEKIRISAGRGLGLQSSTGKILSPVIIREDALVPPYGASINLFYSIELLDVGIRIVRTVPISLLLARENTSAVVQLGGPGAGTGADSPCCCSLRRDISFWRRQLSYSRPGDQRGLQDSPGRKSTYPRPGH